MIQRKSEVIMKAYQPLQGIRILDLSRLLPGPFCTLLLADLGAEVIKVEDVTGGDYIRTMAPFLGKEGAYFLALNPGKKSVALNLKSEPGLQAFRKLAEASNVILEGFRPGTVDRLGIGYEAIKDLNPGIVYCSISGYGQDGPQRDRAGHDLNYIAVSGILGLSGREGVLPTIPPVQIADLSSGLYAATAILAAIRESERSGTGRYIDISMMDSAMSWLIMTAAEFAAGERDERGRLPLTGKFPCYNVYRTGDGYEITLAALESKFWSDFCRTTGRPDLVETQYSTDPEAFSAVEALFASRSREEWEELLQKGDFCCEPVRSLEEAFSHVQVVHRGMVEETKTDAGPNIRLNNPLRQLGRIRPGPCPRLGEHTYPILRELGFSEEDLSGWAASGAILDGRPDPSE
jgi:crotonobetainyl-CoA:carnitine CoA-transferase CaiB-like acyl-CoA transferase